MTYQDEKKGGVLERLAEGGLKLSTHKEYTDLLTLFPDKADLKRSYAEFLFQKKEREAACRNYLQAADLYLKDGKTFQAIVAKILAWRIEKPTHREGRLFHAALQADARSGSPLQDFFNSLPYPEFIAFMLKLVRTKIPAGKHIVKKGGKADALYFIVSGDLEEAAAPPSPGSRKSSRHGRRLSDNDIFGEVFPLDRTNLSSSDVRSLTRAELVKISKPALVEISKNYPLIEKSLGRLHRNPSEGDRAWASVRRSIRHATPVRIGLSIAHPAKPDETLDVEAVSRDMSLGGACVDLGLEHGNVSADDLTGSEARLTVELPNTPGRLSVTGRVVWSKKIKEPGGIGVIAGIRFDAVDRETQDLMKVYCFGIDNEQALMWSLWESYMS